MAFDLSRLATLHREGYNRIRIYPVGDEKAPRVSIRANNNYNAQVPEINEEVPGELHDILDLLDDIWNMVEFSRDEKTGYRGSHSQSIPPPSPSRPHQGPKGPLIKPSR